MQRIFCATAVAVVCGMALSANAAKADDQSPIRLIPTAQASADGSTAVAVTPVRVGVGWRGYGYYGGWNRPYSTYGYGYRTPYYGGYRGYYGGYGPRPYYNAYRGGVFYGPGYRYY